MRYIVVTRPNAKQRIVKEVSPYVFTISVIASPVGGKANNEMLKLLARHLGVASSMLTIKYGARSRRKIVELAE